MTMSCAKTAEPIEMLFELWIRVLGWCPDPPWEETLLGHLLLSCPFTCSQYFQPYSLGGSSGALWLPVYCSNLFLSINVILLQVVCDFLTVGSYCRAIPYSPQVPSGNSIESMIAFPQEPNKKSKIHFFLASNEQDFKYVSTGFFVACGI